MNHASGSTYPELSQRSFNELQIELPPVRKQIGIASILRTLDEKIEVNNQINEDLEAMAQSLFSSWFVDLINYDGETEYDEEFERDVPKAWEKASLDDIAEFLNGKAWKDYSSENGEENDLPVVKIKELRSGISDDSDEVVRSECPIKYILDDGDIVFSWSASLVLDLWSEGDAFLNQHLFKVTSQQYPRWFCYLWIDHHIRIFRHIAEAKKTTMGHIKRTDLEEAKVIVPPEEEIKIMSDKMKPIFEKRVKTQVENGYLEELRDTLLPKLMSGEIRVNDLELDELGVDSEV
jgi:type I restriction enzyme S subunit